MHLFIILILIIAVLVVLLVRDSYRDHRAGQRNLQLHDLANQLGFAFTEKDPPVDRLLQSTRLQQRSGEAHLLLQGHRQDYAISLFDLKDTTAMVIQDEGEAIPRFILQPRSSFLPVNKIIEDEDVASRFETLADVGGHNALFGQDFQLDVHGEDLGRLRARLAGRARELLAARRESRLFVESASGRMLIYVAEEKIPAADIERRMSEAIELATVISGAQKAATADP